MTFCLQEPRQDTPHSVFSPLERSDVLWDPPREWLAALRAEMKRSCTAKIHKFNKHLAVWQTRRLVRAWARGSVSMGEDGDVLAFLGRAAVDAAFCAMGDGG